MLTEMPLNRIKSLQVVLEFVGEEIASRFTCKFGRLAQFHANCLLPTCRAQTHDVTCLAYLKTPPYSCWYNSFITPL